MEEGILKNDVCNRNGCKGIIDEHEKDGSCSCHINPPCSYCTTDTAYCPECGWSAEEEMKQADMTPVDSSWYDGIMKAQEARKQDILAKMRHEKPVDRIEWLSESHTHFSMIKKGVYPDGMTMADVRKEVDGTFGGRFKKFDENVFVFVAYTD